MTVEGQKERDLQRDPRYFLHSYWGEGQDEFAVAGEVGAPLGDEDRARLIELEPRMRYSPVIRELRLGSAHAVTYRNFPNADMYAEVIAWRDAREHVDGIARTPHRPKTARRSSPGPDPGGPYSDTTSKVPQVGPVT